MLKVISFKSEMMPISVLRSMDLITSIASYEKFWAMKSPHSTSGSQGLVASPLFLMLLVMY